MNRRQAGLSLIASAVLATSTAIGAGRLAPGGGSDNAERCFALGALSLPGATILSSGVTAAGESFDSGMPFPGLDRLPFPGPLCRIELKLTPAPGSDIRAEVWLPQADGWNGKLLEAGNGGFGGSLSDPMVTMRHAVLRGFAAAGNDMGHRSADRGWLLREAPVTDYEWRADRATSLAARALVEAYYGRAARLKYYEGCSSGGRQAMMAARRFPEDYDGVVAGAPAAPYSDLVAAGTWMQKLLLKVGARPDADDLKLVGDAALAQCDATDGLKDGLISDPQSCHFNPRKLVCTPGKTTGCLTTAKADFFAQVYRGPRDARGRSILPGLPPGAEAMPGGWSHWITASHARHADFAEGVIGGMMLHDPAWKINDFSLRRDLPKMRRWLAPMNADTPDLARFRRGGGRMIIYHGWADAGVNPMFTVRMRDQMIAAMGRSRTDEVMALFMIPGMAHCAGGSGPDSFQMLDALDAWRDRGTAPVSISGQWHAGPPLAALLDLPSGPVSAERPLCRYPMRARWNGTGDPKAKDSFHCQ